MKPLAIISCLLIILASCQQDAGNIPLSFNTPKVFHFTNNISEVVESDSLIIEGKPFTGYVSDKTKKRFKYAFKNGVQHGNQEGWYLDGKQSFKYVCVNGKREGTNTEYYMTGNLHIQTEYEAGEVMAKLVRDPNGKALVNFVKRDGQYYGLMGSSQCMTLFEDGKPSKN